MWKNSVIMHIISFKKKSTIFKVSKGFDNSQEIQSNMFIRKPFNSVYLYTLYEYFNDSFNKFTL